jgi:hypothetical protein
MNFGGRRLLVGILLLILAAYLASRADSPAALPTLATGLAAGWIAMKVLLRYRNTLPQRSDNLYVRIGVPLGITVATVLVATLGAISASAPLLFGSAVAAFMSGMFLSLRFGAFGDSWI